MTDASSTQAADAPETRAFQAETRELLRIVIHSLYSEREVFLRELISNASDACDKLRVAALQDAALLAGDERLRVRLETDVGARTLVVEDNGVGMSRDEVAENLGTIAQSGTRRFLDELKEGKADAADLPRLIGQFGVGFYATFMVADEVVVETRRAGEDEGTLWRSKGDGEFTIEPCERETRGTRITLHLKEQAEDDDRFQDFTQEWVLRDVVRRYSDFVEYPIEMDVQRAEGEDDEREVVTKTEVLNSQKPLWTRPKSEVTPEEYEEFYHHVSHDWSKPYETIHFRAEGAHAYTALLFVPERKPFDLFDPKALTSKVSLYVKRVQVQAECGELLPPWLRFVRGVVDSDDLPINISRETLQHDRQVKQIRSRLVKKVIDALLRRLAQDREGYLAFWGEFGQVIKEGVYSDEEHRTQIADLCLFQTTADDGATTLDEYVERKPDDQEAIYWISGPDRATLEASPHLEAFRAEGREVLLCTDPVDEWALERLGEHEGVPLRGVEQARADLEDDEAKAAREELQEAHGEFLTACQGELGEWVSEVRFSASLSDSPAVLVQPEGAPSRMQERLMRQMQGDDAPPVAPRVLELNAAHPAVEKLITARGEDDFGDRCHVLYGQACIAEGGAPRDPARFARVLGALLSR